MTEPEFQSSINRICRGDKEGLREIYEAYLPYIFSVVKSIVQNRQDAEDITSEFFIRIWNTAGQYRSGSGHRAYLAAIARNMSIDYLRKHRREIPVDPEASPGKREEAAEGGITPEIAEAYERQNTADDPENTVLGQMALKEALDLLNTKEREVINLKIMGELTFKEIAEILQEPMGTVTWRYRTGIEKLRRCGYESESGK